MRATATLRAIPDDSTAYIQPHLSLHLYVDPPPCYAMCMAKL